MAKSLFTRDHEVLLHLLREMRQRAGLTQIEVGRRLGQTQSYVSKYERGELRLDVVQLRLYCRALGATLPQFATEFEERLKRAARK